MVRLDIYTLIAKICKILSIIRQKWPFYTSRKEAQSNNRTQSSSKIKQTCVVAQDRRVQNPDLRVDRG